MIDHLLFQNDIGHIMKAFITQISSPPTKIMVIGPMFTPEAKVIAETSALYNLVEVRKQNIYTTKGELSSKCEEFLAG